MKTRLFLLTLALCAAALAEGTSGYLFVAPGGLTAAGHTSSTLQIGGGGDIGIWKGLGLGLELSALGPTSDWSETVGVFSPGGTYHFSRDKDQKLDPFLTAGYSLMFREGHLSLFHFGGGVNYWMWNRAGLRVEFRDHVRTNGATLHYWGFRFGLSFR